MKKNIFTVLFICCFLNGYTQVVTNNTAKWRINLSGGIGYDVENTSEDEKSMLDLGFSQKKVSSLINDLKLGGQGNADVHYLLNKNVGIGLKYIFFKNDGKIEEDRQPSALIGIGMIRIGAKQKDIIHYAGPSLHLRSDLGDSRFAVSATLSGGYTHYKSDAEVYIATAARFPNNGTDLELGTASPSTLEGSQFSPSGNTFGMSAGIGLEYFIIKQLAIGFDAGYFYSSLNNIKIDYMGQKISLKERNGGRDALISRLDFSLGIKLYF